MEELAAGVQLGGSPVPSDTPHAIPRSVYVNVGRTKDAGEDAMHDAPSEPHLRHVCAMLRCGTIRALAEVPMIECSGLCCPGPDASTRTHSIGTMWVATLLTWARAVRCRADGEYKIDAWDIDEGVYR